MLACYGYNIQVSAFLLAANVIHNYATRLLLPRVVMLITLAIFVCTALVVIRVIIMILANQN